eukprot:scaffold275356_cov37-Prasinocladus_malaysianus.AAC.2
MAGEGSRRECDGFRFYAGSFLSLHIVMVLYHICDRASASSQRKPAGKAASRTKTESQDK